MCKNLANLFFLLTCLSAFAGLAIGGNTDITTDRVPNSNMKVQSDLGLSSKTHIPLIDYTVEWTLTLGHIAAVGLTPVFDTLLWVSSGGRTGSGDPNWILIYNLRTQTLVDSFPQANSTTWGYRDMCFYNGYVYAGTEATLHKIDPNTHAVVGTYSVSGISGGVIRALTDNDVEDSLWTCNWNVPIYKFPNTGGAVRQVAANTYSIYGLGYDEHGFVWGSSQTTGADLVKYSYPNFTVLDYCAIPELAGGIAGGCEMWNNMFLLYLGQCEPTDKVFCLRLYTVSRDVGILNIVSPTIRIPPSVPCNVEAVIKNFGLNEETFPATALIMTQTDDTVFAVETTLTIPARTEQSVVFGEFTPDPDMVYDVIFYTALVGDENPANDTLFAEARTTPDAGVLRIVAPIVRVTPGILVNASAVVKNFSAEPKDVPATMTIVDTVTGNTILDVDTTLALGAAETLTVVFGQFTAVSGSFYKTIAYTSLAGDDDPSNDTAYATAVCRLGSAPDPFGYYYESTQEPGDTVTFSWIVPTGGTQLTGWSPSADDGYVIRTLPFGFKFYSPASSPPNITQVNVCTNGFLQWPTTATTYTNTAFPVTTISNMIAPFWDDLDLRSQGAVYEKTGTDGAYVAYTWVNVPRFGTSELQTFQVVLYRDNKIRFNYLDVNGTLNSNTIGIQGGTGANGWYQQYVFNGNPANHIPADNVTIAFTCDSVIGIAEAPRNEKTITTVFHAAKPNPVLRGSAQISFSLAKKGDVAISIFDATGRMIRNLVNSSYDAGEYTVTWDGKDGKGANVMSGIYFYTVETSNYTATRKLVLMR